MSSRFFAISFLLHVFLLGFLWSSGLLDSAQTIDQRAKEEISEAMKKAREKRKKKSAVPKSHSEKLKREKERKKKSQAVKRLKRMQGYLKKIQKAKAVRASEIRQRSKETIQESLVAKIRTEARSLEREMKQYRYPGEQRERLRKLTKKTRIQSESLYDDAENITQRTGMKEVTKESFQLAEQNAEAEVDHQIGSKSLGLPEDWHIFRLTKRLKKLVDRLFNPETTQPEYLNNLDDLAGDEKIPNLNLKQLDTAELYRQGLELEKKIAEQYSEVQTLDRAISDVTSYREAKKQSIASDLPNRPDLFSQLSIKPETVEQLAQFRKTIDEFDREVSSMERRSRSLVFQIAGIELDDHAAAIRALRWRNALNLAGSQSHSGYVDLSQFMGGGVGPGRGSDREFRIDREGGKHMAKVDPIRGVRLPKERILAQALSARKISSKAKRKGWLYVDTWYMIGPWENHGAVTYDRLHPPESGIDFDAIYPTGKNGQSLRWQFHQSNNIRIIPPKSQSDATYYFYTEIEFDEPTDVFVAIASDDATKVWLDSQVIWQENGLSQWNIGEGMRKIRFRKGTNRILVRLENGPGETMFSFLLCPTAAIMGSSN